MENGHQKLIAKIQYFYDVLTEKLNAYADHGITSEETEWKKECAAIMTEIQLISNCYHDIFNEFIYIEE